MKFLSMRELRSSTNQIRDMLAGDGKIIVTNNGKPTALMLEISENTLEETLVDLRRLRAKRALRELQEASAKNGTADMTMDAIDAEIAAARAERRNVSNFGAAQ
jgi:PHD/YefM family antitoxin component YafN of YafNO toxin-antitoxin module